MNCSVDLFTGIMYLVGNGVDGSSVGITANYNPQR